MPITCLTRLAVAILLLFTLCQPAQAAGKPRSISTKQLAEQLEQSHIIDTRSRLEYATLRIKGAIHIPVGTMIKEDLQRLINKAPQKALVFYCNGFR
ncbi:MAG: rhodanese-like domain-containing protein [Thermodesulfobacteriota bacterium]